MNLIRGVGDFFALDIGTNAIRIVQLSGGNNNFTLDKFAYVPVNSKLVQDSSALGKRRLAEAIAGAVNQAGIRTKSVAFGLPAAKTFTSIVETETLPEKELAKTFKYELDKYVPMAMSDAKADFVALGPSPSDPGKTEMLVSSSSKKYVEGLLEMLEQTGMDVVAMEPEPLAMARALNPVGAVDATMIVDFGERASDLVIMYKDQPRLVRSIPGGFEQLATAVTSQLGVREDQARQFILKFGLAQDKVEGQVFRILDNMLDNYADELAKSVRFFSTKYPGAKVGGIVLSGFGGTIPFFAEYIEAKTRVSAMRGNPWQFVRMTNEQQNALMSVANEFAVAIGLAERSNS